MIRSDHTQRRESLGTGSRRSTQPTTRMEHAAARRLAKVGTWPGIEYSVARCSIDPRQACQQPDCVRMARCDENQLHTARSTMRPPYITATRSADSATRPRSWVISTIAAPVRTRALGQHVHAPAPGSSRRAPWSARRRSAVQDRWPSPWRSWRAGAFRPRIRADTDEPGALHPGMPTSSSSSIDPAADLRRDMAGWCSAMISAIWPPIRSTGFNDVIGSWKIIAMRRREPRASASNDSSVMSWPRSMTCPTSIRTGLRQQPHHGEHGDAFAGAGLADDAEHLVGHGHRTKHYRSGGHQPLTDRHLDRKIADRENRLSLPAAVMTRDLNRETHVSSAPFGGDRLGEELHARDQHEQRHAGNDAKARIRVPGTICPSLIIRPQLGIGGCTPRPR